jgi:hypothetical protein
MSFIYFEVEEMMVMEFKEAINILCNITRNEEIIVGNATAILNPIINMNVKLKLIINSFEKYDEWAEKDGKNSEAVFLINHFLTDLKTYIDVWETFIKRDMKDLESFYKSTLNSIYDRNFEYRFLYNLRNFSQHCGSPISNVTKSIHNKRNGVLLSKSFFLKEHKNMQSNFKKELNALDIDDLDVDASIVKVKDLLIELHSKLLHEVIMAIKDDVIVSCSNLLKFYRKYNREGGDLALIKDENVDSFVKSVGNKENITLSFSALPINQVKGFAKGITLPFVLEGKFVGINNNWFPFNNPITGEFTNGQVYVQHLGVIWVRVIAEIQFDTKDGNDKLFAVYAINGLDKEIYDEIELDFKQKLNILKIERF